MQGTMQLIGGRPQGDAQQGQGGGNYNQSAPRPQQSRPPTVSCRSNPHLSKTTTSRSNPTRALRRNSKHRSPLWISTALMTISRSSEP